MVLPVRKVFNGASGRKAWLIIRRTENLPLVVGGRLLPDTAWLGLYRSEAHKA